MKMEDNRMNPTEPKPTGKPNEIVVFMVRRETKCAECAEGKPMKHTKR